MTALNATIAPSAWSWWEGRRLSYNLALFVTGWVGFAFLLAISVGGDASALATMWLHNGDDLVGIIIRLGTIYLLYMAAANVLFLLGPLLEALLKPEPVESYRGRAWVMGLLLSVALPLIAAVNLGLLIWDPGHGG